jgi:hypothetical protein
MHEFLKKVGGFWFEAFKKGFMGFAAAIYDVNLENV